VAAFFMITNAVQTPDLMSIFISVFLAAAALEAAEERVAAPLFAAASRAVV
jgi:hypothetical protein